MKVGICGYAVYLPYLRISGDEYKKAWGSFSAGGVKEKTVMDFDEDVLTMGAEAIRKVLGAKQINPAKIDALSLGSTTFPYDQKVAAGTVAEMIGLRKDLVVTEHGTSQRAGMEAVLSALVNVEAFGLNYGLGVVSDSPLAEVKNNYEHPFGAGAAVFLCGKDEVIAEFEGQASFTTELIGDRFRPYGERYLVDIGVANYTNTAYTTAISECIKRLLGVLRLTPADYAHLVLPQKDARTPAGLARKAGFSEEQLKAGLLATYVGDAGAASPFLGFAGALDAALPGQRIMVVAYGHGLSATATSWRVTEAINNYPRPVVEPALNRKQYIDYFRYLKIKRVLV
ncbi:MAG: hydroxymethylglutaryl-CoA synthase [Firmicutes bacterium]|nr:hydroxymethylglutaryl-CoA synthase [Bacillota bacterium]